MPTKAQSTIAIDGTGPRILLPAGRFQYHHPAEAAAVSTARLERARNAHAPTMRGKSRCGDRRLASHHPR